MDSRTKKQLRDLALKAKERKDSLYVVGGTVRDQLLGRNFRDIDLVCVDAGFWAHWFSKHINSSVVTLHDTPGQEVLRVPISKNFYCDFCTRQGNSLEEDLSHRDFTINSLAQTLDSFLDNKRALTDLFNGLQDIDNRIIRLLPSDPIKDDPLRMLRAFRQAAVLNLRIASDTLDEIKEKAYSIYQVSSERISQELLQFFNAQRPDIHGFLGTGLLSELMNYAGIVYCEAEHLLDHWNYYQTCWDDPKNPLRRYKNYYEDLLKNNSQRAQFGISLLFAHLNFKAANKFLEFYKFSNRQTENVVDTVQLCKIIDQYWIDNRNQPSGHLLYQWCSKFEKSFPQALLLASISLINNPDKSENLKTFSETCFNFYRNQYLPAITAKPLISGNDLQETFNLKPSPVFKTLLEKIREARVLGEVKTKEQAESLIPELLKKESN
ncbi:MAG: hypothetical protein G3M70_14635 [Candidatus Nitronauta litoralis]|uniref:CCA tRNA nucleotidyltransferase n=1 Tax=Candidatus Nitronauta litoralis TaxID=2705533 RepID=A0A7T0BY16_9BACT|nr:MAG: hypothetical protein G3M70_14635 [Candidatus Nitronauta litoralis]